MNVAVTAASAASCCASAPVVSRLKPGWIQAFAITALPAAQLLVSATCSIPRPLISCDRDRDPRSCPRVFCPAVQPCSGDLCLAVQLVDVADSAAKAVVALTLAAAFAPTAGPALAWRHALAALQASTAGLARAAARVLHALHVRAVHARVAGHALTADRVLAACQAPASGPVLVAWQANAAGYALVAERVLDA